ncbi:SAM-dependent methyltransferase [Streptomyces sp. NPDC054863]
MRTVFEIDEEDVLTYKHRVLDELDAVPRARRVAVAADLRLDWAGALKAAGFDPARSIVWLAEGLLLYLPSAAEQRLIGVVDRLSVAKSTLAYRRNVGLQVVVGVVDGPLRRCTESRRGVVPR